MNRSSPTAIRKTVSLFLAFILTAGTITAIFPSSSIFITKVDVLSDYGIQDNYKSTKDISNDVNTNKIKYINDNININGVNAGNIKAGNNGLATSASSFGNDERYYGKEYYNKKDKVKALIV